MLSIGELYRKGRTIVPDSKKNRTLVFLVVLIGTSLDNFNIAATMTSYFSIVKLLDTTSTTASWVLSSYSLTLGAFIIISGKLADVFGPQNTFIIGIFFSGIFALISAVIPNSVIAIIVIRAFQGAAASVTIPSAFAFVGTFYEGKAQERGVSFLLIALNTILGIGFVVGGAFSEADIGYKGVYYLTFALATTVSVSLFFLSPDLPRTEEHKKLKARNLDYGGSIFLVIGLLLIILGLTEGGSSWKKPSAYVPIPIGFIVVLLVVLFETVYIQRYKELDERKKGECTTEKESFNEDTVEIRDWRVDLELLFPKEAFAIPNFFPYFLGTAITYISFIAITAGMVQYYQYVELQSPIMTGVKTLPIAGGLLFGAVIYRDEIAGKVGYKLCCILAAVIQLTMAVWLSRLDPSVKNSYWKYEFISQFIFGYGTNLYFEVYWTAVMNGCPKHLLGVVSAILMTSGQIGLCLGNALVATILGELPLSQDWNVRLAIKEKVDNCFYMAFGSTALMILLMLCVRKVKKEVV